MQDVQDHETKCKFTDWFRCVRWVLVVATRFMMGGVVFFGAACFMALMLKFPVAREYEVCEGSAERGQTPFHLDRDTGNFVWISSMAGTAAVLNFAHFRQRRMYETKAYETKTFVEDITGNEWVGVNGFLSFPPFSTHAWFRVSP